MEIANNKKKILSLLALTFGIIPIVIAIMELILIGVEAVAEDVSILFFTSPGDAVFESSALDHVMKAFVNFLIGGIFLHGYQKVKEGNPDGFSFLIGGGILLLGIGFLFIMIWGANLIDTVIKGFVEPEVWGEYIFTDGIRIEWFLGVGAISILSIWKNKEQYLTQVQKF